VLAARTPATSGAQAIGGPSAQAAAGPAAQAAEAPQVAASNVTRTSAGEAAPGAVADGGGNPESTSSAPLAEQIARSASPASASPLAMAAPARADLPASPAGATGGGPEGGQRSNPEPASATVAQADGGRQPAGALSADAQAGPPVDASGGELVAQASVGRAESSRAASGAPALGGGTDAPEKAALGPALAVNTRADVPTLSGAPTSSGARSGSPLESTSSIAQAQPGGIEGPASREPIGAASGEVAVDGAAAQAAPAAVAATRAGPSGEAAPAAEGVAVASAPRRAATVGGPAGLAVAAVEPVAVPGAPGGSADTAVALAGGEVGPMSRETPGGLAVNIDAVEGPGGLGSEQATNAGYVMRQTRADSLKIEPVFARFDRQETAGRPRLTTSAVVATDPFRGRTPPGTGPGGRPGNTPPETEESIELGLVFLARHQSDDGSWRLNGFGAGPEYQDEEAVLNSDTAATALALLAFQGAGYNHREFRYRDAVRSAVDWLVRHQKADGDLYVPFDDQSSQSVWLYSHSIAALALCEAYGMTQDPELREPAQKALNFIIAAQEDRGGWRYAPGYGSDTSVTGWMMMALKSGELAGLEVPDATYDKIRKWLDRAQSPGEPHLYRYNPYAPDTPTQRHGRETSKTMSSVGLLMRMYTGWRRDNAGLAKGADYLAANLPTMGNTRDPQRDTYYWYYATQVMFHMGGDHWKRWNETLHPLLVNSQEPSGPLQGSWDPLAYPAGNRRIPIADRWGPHAGRIYVTTMNLLSLEVYYRHLPLYDDTAK
jgi:hypothetical protein